MLTTPCKENKASNSILLTNSLAHKQDPSHFSTKFDKEINLRLNTRIRNWEFHESEVCIIMICIPYKLTKCCLTVLIFWNSKWLIGYICHCCPYVISKVLPPLKEGQGAARAGQQLSPALPCLCRRTRHVIQVSFSQWKYCCSWEV